MIVKAQQIEIVQSYRYLGVYLDSKLNWIKNTEVVFKKAQSRLLFLRKFRSFDISKMLLHVLYQGILARALFPTGDY